MTGFTWSDEDNWRYLAIRDDLSRVSTASACQLLIAEGWRNAYMVGLLPLRPMGLGIRTVGRARTCRYLMRRGPAGGSEPEARRVSPEIVAIESIEAGDIFCVDALGVPTSGIIGDIMAGVQVRSGDILLADDEGVIAMPLEQAEIVARLGPPKERLEMWIRDKIVAGGSVHDYYPPGPARLAEYQRETGERYDH